MTFLRNLRKHKFILAGLAVLLIAVVCFAIWMVGDSARQRALAAEADFTIVLKGKTCYIPSKLTAINGDWDYENAGANRGDIGTRSDQEWLTVQLNKADPLDPKATLQCHNPLYGVPGQSPYTFKSDFLVLGMFVTKEYDPKASINGVRLSDSKEVLFQTLGEPALVSERDGGKISYSYYYNLEQNATLQFFYDSASNSFDSFRLQRDIV